MSRTVADARLFVYSVTLLRSQQAFAARLVQVSQIEHGRSRAGGGRARDGITLTVHSGLSTVRDDDNLIGKPEPLWSLIRHEPDIDPQRHGLIVIALRHTDGPNPDHVLELDNRFTVLEPRHARQSLAYSLTGHFQVGHSGQEPLPPDLVIGEEKFPPREGG